jgi:DNA-binding NarL/FixJ family response regulator
MERVPVANENEHNASVLIAARPCRMRDSLRLLLKTMPGIEIVGHADDSASALRMVAEHHPALVLLDTNLPGEGVATVLQQIKASGSPSRCLVLAGSSRQQRKAREAGADAALLGGFSATELFEAIEGLLDTNDHPPDAGVGRMRSPEG